ncbi:MAG: ABC transporter permease [Planctomycetota bacterium]
MSPIEAKDQAPLSVGRCARLALSGMSYRLLRSGITTAILALAVAFLVHVVTHAIWTDRAQGWAWNALEPTRTADAWLTRLTTPDPVAQVRDSLGGLGPAAADRTAEYTRWSGRDDADVALGAARRFHAVQAWAERLTPTQSAVVLGGLDVSAWLSRLAQQPTARARLDQQLTALQLGPPGAAGRESFDRFVREDWPRLSRAVAEIRDHHAQAIDRLRAADTRPMLRRFLDPGPTLYTQLRDAGFEIREATYRELQAYAAYRQVVETVAATLQDPERRRRVEVRAGSADLPAVMAFLATRRGAAWWSQDVAGAAEDATARDFLTAGQRYTREQRWAAATEGYEPRRPAAPDATPGNKANGEAEPQDAAHGGAAEVTFAGVLPTATWWLVGLSLLVCAVGVSNALLMSVTERFSEIATMKCLGAMDRSVMQMFVAEAVIQGGVGGVAGVGIGWALTAGRGLWELGGLWVHGAASWPAVVVASAVSLGVGVGLAAAAAVGPAWVASRLAPMEAMRVE